MADTPKADDFGATERCAIEAGLPTHLCKLQPAECAAGQFEVAFRCHPGF